MTSFFFIRFDVKHPVESKFSNFVGTQMILYNDDTV